MAKVYNVFPMLDVPYYITAIESIKGKIFTGDSKGNIYSYQIYMEGAPDENISSVPETQNYKRSKIDRIVGDAPSDKLFVFTEGSLFSLDIDTLEEIQNLGKNYNLFALNRHPSHSGSVCAFQKKRIFVWKYSWNIRSHKAGQGGYIPERNELTVPEVPVSAAWYGDSLCMGFQRKNYMIMNVTSGQQYETEVPVSPSFSNFPPYIKVIGSDFLCASTHYLCFIEAFTYRRHERNTINLDERRGVLSIAHKDPYIIVMTERTLEVYNKEESMRIEQVQFPDRAVGISLSDSGMTLVYATTQQIWALKPIPFNDQIMKLLLECKITEAKALLDKNIDPSSESAGIEYDKFNLDAAWCLFRNLKFRQSLDYFRVTNFDPRDLMSLFREYCDRRLLDSLQNEETIQNLTRALMSKIHGQVDSKVIEQLTQSSKFCVIDLLLLKRQTIIKPPKAAGNTERFQYLHSRFAINNVRSHEISKSEVLESIDTFLLKCFVSIGTSKQGPAELFKYFQKDYLKILEEMFDPTFKLSLNFHECVAFLDDIGDPAKNAMGMLYEAYNYKIDALNKWRELGMSNDVDIKTQAARQTVKILRGMSDKQTIYDYCHWVLQEFPDIGIEIFKGTEELHHIPYDEILYKLKEYSHPNYSLFKNYLDYIIKDKKVDADRFHNYLALEYYVSGLFEKLPASEKQIPERLKADTLFMKKYKDLNLFLEESNCYHIGTVYDEIKDSWMIEVIVLLLSKQKRHEEALQKLVNYGLENKDFKMAEKYCTKQKGELLNELLKIYIDKAEHYNQKMNSIVNASERDALKSKRKQFIKHASDLLKNYATHSQLNPVKVLDIIPDDWNLFSLDYNFLHNYFYVTMSNTLHEARQAQVIKQLSEMELMRTDCEWSQKRNASVRVKPEKVCDKCKKKIGKNPFCVYPNGKVVHYTCMGSPTVCPVTNTNFESLII